MPSDPSGKPTQGWRQQVTKAKRNGDALPEWRKELAAPTTQPRPSRKRLKLFLVGAALATILGLLIWLALRPKPPGHSTLVLVGAGYEENLGVPHNVYGREGLKALADWTAGYKKPFLLWGGEIPRLQHQTLEFRSTNRWDKDLDKFDEQTIIVYFALHGGVDSKGAYLLPHDADPANPAESRLYLEDILARLAQLPEKKKVLILDATQVTADWSRGMLHNDFARALEKLDEHIAKVPDLIVISASDKDQKSWVSEQWRKTIFGHHVVEGLKGAADDRREGGDGNKLVTAKELMAYLRKNVERWVRDNRAALQTPVLLPKADGDQRAGGINLAQVKDGYQTPEPKPLAALPGQLTKAWQDYQHLDSLTPSPAVYAPQQWRHYQTTLLRYEQLLRAGAEEAANKLGGQLQTLERDLTRGQVLELSSMQNTLAMPAAAGAQPFTPDPVRRRSLDQSFLSQFQGLWTAPKEEQSPRWAQLQQQYGAQLPLAAGVSERVRRQLVRARVYEQLLELAAENQENFKKAHELLQVVDDPVSPRPAEINYLAVVYRTLNQDLAGNPPDKKFPVEFREALKAALRVRRLAERAAVGLQIGDHPYSEQVHRWVQMQVETADELRARGQDLLFRSDRDKLLESLRLLSDAKGKYQAAQDSAEVVQKALTIRDRAQADLFFYSQWLAQRRLPDARQLQLAEELWENLHRLSETLEKPNPKGIDQLRDQTEGASKAFNQLRSDFDEHCSGLSKAALPTTPRDLDDVLLVPMNDASLRIELLNHNRSIGQQLLVETAQRTDEVPSIPLEQNQAWAKDAAQRQGRMALAVLGSRWFNETPGADLERYGTMKDLLDPETFPNRQRWWEDLAKVGEQVGRRWRQLPVVLNQEADNWRKATGKQAMEVLPRADRLARLFDGTASLPATLNPTQEFRLALTRDLLLWQTDRTVKEHWYSEKPGDEPYYLVAGREYLNDVVVRLDSRKHHTEAAEALKSRLKLDRLVVDGPADLDWTSEQRLDFPFYLRPDRDAWVPPGHAVVWVETDGELLRPINPEAANSSDWKVGLKPERVGPISLTLESPHLQAAQKTPPSTLDLRSTTVTLRGVYRGQRIEQKAQVDLHPLADTIRVQYPPPDRGSIAVWAHPDIHTQFGASNSALAILLDCSVSMEGKRFQDAINALEQILKTIPRGTTVSLWVFGQNEQGVTKHDDVEATVKRLQNPVVWNPADKDANGDIRQVKSLMMEVRKLKPWGLTPIVRTMMDARDDLKGKTGYKTMLVLTDGMDTRFEKGTFSNVNIPSKGDPKYNPNGQERIPSFIQREFKDLNIEVNIVGFQLSKDDDKLAKEQFQKAIESLQPKGKFYDVQDARTLVATLQQAMRQRLRYWIETASGEAVSQEERDISQPGLGDQWFPGGLEPAAYRLRVKANKDLYKHVDISRGDLLLANLVLTKTREIDFQRVFVSKTDYGPSGKVKLTPLAEANKWCLTSLQNQLSTGGAMQMLLGLEKEPEPPDPKITLQFVKAWESWFEVKPRDSVARIAQRWAYVPGYPLPTYGADVGAWPSAPGSAKPAKPDVSVWFSPKDQERPPSVTLNRGPDFKTLDDLQNRVVQVDGHDVLIENVRVETHWVRTRPDKEPEQQECLVVRLKLTDNPADKTRDSRVWVQVEGLEPRGQEHRFYGEAGKYSGLFWSVNADQLREKLSSLRLTSVAAFKRDAEKTGFTIRLQDLQAPGANDVRPPAIEPQ